MVDDDKNTWNEWSRHVLSELERLNGNCEDISKEMQNISIEIATLKVKAGILGAFFGILGGAIPAIIYLLFRLI